MILTQVMLFEIRFWLRSWTLWLFLLIISVLIVGATNSDDVIAELNLSNIYRNAPFVIAYLYAAIGVFTLLMTTVFVNSAALRDFNCNTHPIIFSTPVRRRDLLLGRFLGATAISVIPMLGVSLGMLVAKHIPWTDRGAWTAVSWAAHLKGVLLFALPDTLFIAAILFAVAIGRRREVHSFIAVLVMIGVRAVTLKLFNDPHHEVVHSLLDPFAVKTFNTVTKYWTVTDKNNLSVSFVGLLFWNRLIWTCLGGAALGLAYRRFRATEMSTDNETPKLDAQEPLRASAGLSEPPASLGRTGGTWWKQFPGAFLIHFRGMARNTAFVVIIGITTMVCVVALAFTDTLLNNRIFPVTYWVIDQFRGTLDIFLLVIVTYFAGALVWKDREQRLDEITDATPAPEWLSYASRLTTLVAMVMLIQFVALVAGIADQALHGYYRFQIGLYVRELLVRDTSWLLFVAVIAFVIHTLTPNKYVGYFVFITFYVLNTYLWRPLNVATNLVQFGARPTVIYSDFFGDAPYRTAWNWFTLYWLVFCVLLGIVSVLFWPRGKEVSWRARLRAATLRFTFRWRVAASVSLLVFTACGAWIWYNTEIVNPLLGPKETEQRQAEYEKAYKALDKRSQPRVRRISYAVDIFPESRNVSIRGDEVIFNPYSSPMDEVDFSLDPLYNTTIDVSGARLIKDDSRLSYQIYRFDPPLRPGEERSVNFVVRDRNRGFENEVTNAQIVENGSFLNTFNAPVIGYNYTRQLSDPVQRRKYGLPGLDLMPPLEPACTDDCDQSDIPGHPDWAEITTVISTTPDQIAIAPGSLVHEWQRDGRRYFEYRVDHPSLNFCSFVSGHYEVTREVWNGIQLEVYYLKQHPWNVSRMMDSMKRSLDYYIKNFGPYEHKQARIIEFPRVADFAQAFPGTMPYSESSGFIADLRHPEDIDVAFYGVAHEMAHQWWAHQVVGANMEGATLLSETLAQYSAFMVMEKEYGPDMMRKFLLYEMDGYLRSRGKERLKEHPLLTVEYQQAYIHYQKGGVVLYYMKEMIGEDAVNRALRSLIHQYAYAPPPYPTSYALVTALRKETPAPLQYLLDDLFTDITLFSNRTLNATYRKRPDGRYDVTIDVEARKFKADADGRETEVPVDDWIDIGAFGKTASKHEFGETVYRERVHIAKRYCTFTFTTNQPPAKAGIDPFALLIDKTPTDNLKDVREQ